MKKIDSLADKYFWTPILFLLENPFWLLPLFLFLFFGFRCFIPSFGDNYSNGVREGLLQKYAVKGLIWKTGEGEMVLNSFRFQRGNNSGGGSEMFYFSDAQKKDYSKFVGKNVKVFYTQALHRPYSEGGTNYRLDSIQVLE